MYFIAFHLEVKLVNTNFHAICILYSGNVKILFDMLCIPIFHHVSLCCGQSNLFPRKIRVTNTTSIHLIASSQIFFRFHYSDIHKYNLSSPSQFTNELWYQSKVTIFCFKLSLIGWFNQPISFSVLINQGVFCSDLLLSTNHFSAFDK